jgi:hypothetical protein
MARLIIDAAQRGIRFSFKELFDYRDLFLILAYRDCGYGTRKLSWACCGLLYSP